MNAIAHSQAGKLTTGIPGFDHILDGGIPELSICIIAGSPGTGKTMLTQQIINANASPSRKALCLTTLSESPVKMLRHMQKLSFFDASKIGSSVIYLDVGQTLLEEGIESTLAIIVKHVEEHQPAIVSMDGFKAIHDMTRGPAEERRFGYELAVRLAAWGVTALLVGEYTLEDVDHEAIFTIADAIIRLDNQLQEVHYQRYVDVMKLRGEDYFRGLHPFTIGADGLTVYPRVTAPAVYPDYEMPLERVPTGLPQLDAMLEGGFPAGSATIIAGATGTGKTLFGVHFITAGAARGEPGVIVTLQENPMQLRGIALAYGWDLQALEAQGLLTHLYTSPVELQPDIHAERLKAAVQRIGARRVLIDPITFFEMATPNKVRYKDYIYALINAFKVQGITVLLTHEIPELFGPLQLNEYGISFITDNVILLRYMELYGRMGRAINVMKVRGSQHSKEIREFTITTAGMRLGEPVQALTGVLAGAPVVRGDGHLRDLPGRARYLVETIARQETSTLPHLLQETGLTRDRLEAELAILEQQGLVLAMSRDDEVCYRTTV